MHIRTIDRHVDRLLQTGAIEATARLRGVSEDYALIDLSQGATAALGLAGWGILSWPGSGVALAIHPTREAADQDWALALHDLSVDAEDEREATLARAEDEAVTVIGEDGHVAEDAWNNAAIEVKILTLTARIKRLTQYIQGDITGYE